jgi:hypothetical protein
MKRACLALTASLLATPCLAALQPGAKAPDFTTQATLGTNEFTFKLADALKKGPVVLYFYPAAFTSGCTEEAHEFADATPQFQALGATVIGISEDDIPTAPVNAAANLPWRQTRMAAYRRRMTRCCCSNSSAIRTARATSLRQMGILATATRRWTRVGMWGIRWRR